MTESAGTPGTGSLEDAPNVLWIETDEIRPDVVAALSSYDWLDTPNLDRLVETGVGFSNAYCNSPQCTPARASYLTGQYPSENGIVNNAAYADDRAAWRPDVLPFPRMLENAGYSTTVVGKTHIPESEKRVWQDTRLSGFPSSVANPFGLTGGLDEEKYNVIHYGYDSEKGVVIGGQYPKSVAEGTPATKKTDAAIDVMEENRNTEDPFLLRVSYLWPHTPKLAPEPFYSKYDREDMPIPEMRFENIPRYYELIKHWTGISEEDLREVWGTFYGLISHLDAEVGKMLDYLEANGMRENTIVVFMGDHGSSLGSNGMWTKGTFDTESAGVPFLLSYPGTVPGGQVVDGLVSLLDLAPTVMDLAGLEIPQQFSGEPLLTDPSSPITHDAVFGEIVLAKRHRVWVRTEDYSYDRNWPRNCSSDAALFDQQADPDQQVNVAGEDDYSDVVDRLDDRLEEWYSSLDVNPNAYPEPTTSSEHC